ncbi:hypothetical protein BH20ACT23_BH20ACT23_14870 [soil metagenome]
MSKRIIIGSVIVFIGLIVYFAVWITSVQPGN